MCAIYYQILNALKRMLPRIANGLRLKYSSRFVLCSLCLFRHVVVSWSTTGSRSRWVRARARPRRARRLRAAPLTRRWRRPRTLRTQTRPPTLASVCPETSWNCFPGISCCSLLQYDRKPLPLGESATHTTSCQEARGR